jgi:ParB-like chromosome segregation protein Spo0J
MQIVNIRVADIKPYENNPRRNTDAVRFVKNSIEQFGFKIPMVLDTNNVIVCGHTRYMAAQELGMEEVPCLYADDLTEQQIKAFRIADNKTAEMSAWDFEKLDIELQDIADIDMTEFGFQNTDFNEGALDDLFTDAPEKEKEPKKIQCPHCGEWFEVE